MAAWQLLLKPAEWVRTRVFLLRDRVRELHAVAGLIADELKYNAHILGRYEDGTAIQELQANLRFGVYDAHAKTAYAFERRDPELWREVVDAYGALQRTASTGVFPPFKSLHLVDLAERLREARY